MNNHTHVHTPGGAHTHTLRTGKNEILENLSSQTVHKLEINNENGLAKLLLLGLYRGEVVITRDTPNTIRIVTKNVDGKLASEGELKFHLGDQVIISNVVTTNKERL